MNKLNFVQKLPIGFRFEPTDEEIVFQYLVRKVFSYPLPSLIIPEILFNIFSLHPSQLPASAGDSEQDRYFFSRNYGNNGTSCCGYWKPFGSDKQIISSKMLLPILGIKKTLVFYKGASSSTTDNWFMNVYHIAFSDSGNNNRAANCNIQQKITNFQFQGSLIQMGNWVLCHMFVKKRSSSTAITSYYDSMEADIISDSSDSSNSSDSSDSSSLTDDDDEDDDVSSSTSIC